MPDRLLGAREAMLSKALVELVMTETVNIEIYELITDFSKHFEGAKLLGI